MEIADSILKVLKRAATVLRENGVGYCLAGGLAVSLLAIPVCSIAVFAQKQDSGEEIVTSLTGGRVFLHVAKEGVILFAAVDQPDNPT